MHRRIVQFINYVRFFTLVGDGRRWDNGNSVTTPQKKKKEHYESLFWLFMVTY